MLSKEEIESMKIGLWNIRADILKAMQCSLADTSDKKEWQKEINTIDNALKYIDQLETDKQNLIEKLEERIRYFEENDELLATTYDNYSDGTVTKRIIDEFRKLLLIVKGVENENNKI